jgi:single-strand DNA-binding protein
MASLNKVILIGKLGSDIDLRVVNGGAKVVNISLATTKRFKDRQGNRKEKTTWHNLVFWNKTAEQLEQYAKKGSELYVEGEFYDEEYTPQGASNSVKVKKVEVRHFQITSGFKEQGGQQRGGPDEDPFAEEEIF